MNKATRLFTTREAAEYCKVKFHTFRTHVRKGLVKPFAVFGRENQFTQYDLLLYRRTPKNRVGRPSKNNIEY